MAKKQIRTFGEAKSQKLSQIADSWSGMGSDRMPFPPNSVGKWVMKAIGPITACDYRCSGSGSAEKPMPGSGTAALCYRDKTTGLLELHKPGGLEITCTVYSLLAEAVPDGWFFIGTRDLAGTIWAESIFQKCDEASGSGGSGSGGSGSGSGSGCIDVVTGISFDLATCQLVVCTRNICFPAGTIIGPEDCGSGSGGA